MRAQEAHAAAAPKERDRWRGILHAAARALHAWVAAALCWLELLEAREVPLPDCLSLHAAVAATHDLVRRLLAGSMFAAVLRGTTSEDVETLQLASECVVAVIAAASKLEETAAAAAAGAANKEGGEDTATAQGGGSKAARFAALIDPPLGGPAANQVSVSQVKADCRCLLDSIIRAYAEGCSAALAAAKTQERGIAAFDVGRLQVFAQGLTELAKAQLPRVLAAAAEAEALLEEGEAQVNSSNSSSSSSSSGGSELAAAAALLPAVETICELARELLRHPSYEAKELSVSFYRNLLSHMIVLVDEERRLGSWVAHLRNEAAAAAGAAAAASTRAAGRPFDGGADNTTTATAPPAAAAAAATATAAAALREVELRYERAIDTLAQREPLLSSLFVSFAEAALEQLQPPVVLLLKEELEFEEWQSFRSELGATVTEAAVLLDLDGPCNKAAKSLLQLLKDTQARPSVSFR
ncbi:hypothetical protein ACSSS7_007817 [Eimeria intestinalis]